MMISNAEIVSVLGGTLVGSIVGLWKGKLWRYGVHGGGIGMAGEAVVQTFQRDGPNLSYPPFAYLTGMMMAWCLIAACVSPFKVYRYLFPAP